ncbi:response regulator [Microvirga sp. SRT01]|jgi:CheY-like chemotaxis protein|uniref:Response regulator n=1 Tax=Sphingomonas longa TaxID=2778730 RepID=A0ABS2DAB6_9SPHN|nr:MULTISPECIES: response regulator [Alphaproteobacteria]MBM6577884.1 response regulator [Sphingomonas sp. BT552]MBR7710925.1 response regulator [Microvirga sp. SRT01]
MTHILIVEDNELNRDMLQRRLERKGYAVSCAVDGPQGIAMATTTRPDIILMDVALGDMDGWEATMAIHADPRSATIPVIALTAHALESDRLRSIEAGCVDFETKPVSLPDLIAKIEQHATVRNAA